jgi:hypothetical protein
MTMASTTTKPAAAAPVFHGSGLPAFDQVRLFFNLLDPGAKRFTFQTFQDKKPVTRPELAKVTEDKKLLLQLHAHGAGIYITVNETDGKGRCSDNIVRVRAIWQEDDNSHDGPFPLAPSMVVATSQGHFHRYWLIADDWPADQQGRADFASVMERMVESYGSDKNAKDIARVLRVPGFLHRKVTPALVRIIASGERRYTRAEIVAVFPPVMRQQPQKPSGQQKPWQSRNDEEERIRDAIFAINSDDRDTWLQIGMALKDHVGDGGRALWDQWSRGSNKYNERDQDRTWKSFKRNGITIATLFHHAQQSGWRPSCSRTQHTSSASSAPESPSPAAPAWPTMNEAAWHGVAGDVVRTIEPHSESDPVAILIQFLTCAGNIIGNCPFYQVEGTRHRANLFAVLVGETAKARKGTSWDRISEIVRIADERWYAERAKGGLSSGEGLINEVRDPVQKWNSKEKQFETLDPGIADKRLMVTESEFAGVLAVAERHGNTISSTVRKAWDGSKLATMTRSSALSATGAHISIIGHITEDELRARLTRTDTANGFGNRFLFMLVKRSKVLPFGGDGLPDEVIFGLGERLKAAVVSASAIGRIGWTDAAADVWKAVYGPLSEGQRGLLGAVTSRAEAQVVRLALIYAALDGASNIDIPHIKAALAVWEYAEASAAHIFGASLGDPVADDIMRALHQAGSDGMTRTAIRDYFGRHQSGDRIGAALALLVTKGQARVEYQKSGGRPVETWFATNGGRHG